MTDRKVVSVAHPNADRCIAAAAFLAAGNATRVSHGKSHAATAKSRSGRPGSGCAWAHRRSAGAARKRGAQTAPAGTTRPRRAVGRSPVSSTRFSARPSKLEPTRTRQSPPTSISMASEADGAGRIPPLRSGSGVIVTGTSPLDDDEDDGVVEPDFSASRRQRKTWLALTSYWRATTETEAPGR